jgi:hypothetical protein
MEDQIPTDADAKIRADLEAKTVDALRLLPTAFNDIRITDDFVRATKKYPGGVTIATNSVMSHVVPIDDGPFSQIAFHPEIAEEFDTRRTPPIESVVFTIRSGHELEVQHALLKALGDDAEKEGATLTWKLDEELFMKVDLHSRILVICRWHIPIGV